MGGGLGCRVYHLTIRQAKGEHDLALCWGTVVPKVKTKSRGTVGVHLLALPYGWCRYVS